MRDQIQLTFKNIDRPTALSTEDVVGAAKRGMWAGTVAVLRNGMPYGDYRVTVRIRLKSRRNQLIVRAHSKVGVRGFDSREQVERIRAKVYRKVRATLDKPAVSNRAPVQVEGN